MIKQAKRYLGISILCVVACPCGITAEIDNAGESRNNIQITIKPPTDSANARKKIISEITPLMKRCAVLLDQPLTPDIRLTYFSDIKLFRKAVVDFEVSSPFGFYDYKTDRIYLSPSSFDKGREVLRHEISHQYLQGLYAFKTPDKDHKKFGSSLVALPVWLQEGFACCMEKSALGKLHINKDRFRDIRNLLRYKAGCDLKDLLGITYNTKLKYRHYAYSWALVYVLLTDKSSNGHPLKPRLMEYLRFAKKGFSEKSTSDLLVVYEKDDSAKANKKWDEAVHKRSVAAFQTIIMKGEKWSTWERWWAKKVRRIR